MQHKVYILTGAIQTGKTTSLLKWCKGKENIHGILTPVVDGKRMFMNIATKEMFDMEASEDETDFLKIGRFVFSSSSFEKARQIIVDSTSCNYLTIDEVGPLELKLEGLFNVIQHVLHNQSSNIILVVREGLVNKVIKCFSITNPTIISKTTLELL